MLNTDERECAINNFVQIVRFPTISSLGPVNGSYNDCANWILQKCLEIGLESSIIPESKTSKPIVVATWRGEKPDLPALLLNSHYDVVPVLDEYWNVPAFEGLRKDGRIYGRGTQDMKCVCIQYITALSKLKSIAHSPLRTIHLSFVPDEEVSGVDGMGILLRSEWYKSVRIGLALDEGLANEGDEYSVFYGERLPWWVKVTAEGNSGHGSRFIEGTAMEQIIGVANKALEFRKEQYQLLHGISSSGGEVGCSHCVAAKKSLGDVTSLNITMLRGGVQAGGEDVYNVVPARAEAGFDIRVAPAVPPDVIINKLESWCQDVQSNIGGIPGNAGLKWEFVCGSKRTDCHATTLPSGPWWQLFTETLLIDCKVSSSAQVFPAATDSRFLRALGVRAFGFSPMKNCPILLHEHNEYLEESVFLEGCEVYIRLLKALSMQDEFEDDK